MVEERILSFSIAHLSFGPRRVAAVLARPEWGGIAFSANGVWRSLLRHGLNNQDQALRPGRDYRARYEPPRELGEEPPIGVGRRASWWGWTASTSDGYARRRSRVAVDRDRHRLLLRLR
jgi:hypothetical protein